MTFTIARAPTLPIAQWRAFTASLSRTNTRINRDDPIIFGEYGSGSPIITDDVIIFNGNALAHRWRKRNGNPHLLDGESSDAHEDFVIPRIANTSLTTGFVFGTTITLGKPYALAVRAALILARHSFPTETQIIAAPGSPDEWERAFTFARSAEPDVTLPNECPSATRRADGRRVRATA